MLTVKTFAPILAAVLLAAVLTPAAQAKGNAEAGATKAAVCTACHGVNGNSVNPEWPNLAGQNADRKSTRLNSSHVSESRMPSSA